MDDISFSLSQTPLSSPSPVRPVAYAPTAYSKLTPDFFRGAFAFGWEIISNVQVCDSGVRVPLRALRAAAHNIHQNTPARYSEQTGKGIKTPTLLSVGRLYKKFNRPMAYLYQDPKNGCAAIYLTERTEETKKIAVIPLPTLPWKSCKSELASPLQIS